jgi:hypothetical protein
MADTVTMAPANGRKPLHERVPLEAITADARKASPGKVILGLIGGLIFAIAWLTAKAFTMVFFAFAWCASAAKMGWRTARDLPLNQPDVKALIAENDMLRAQIERYQIG